MDVVPDTAEQMALTTIEGDLQNEVEETQRDELKAKFTEQQERRIRTARGDEIRAEQHALFKADGTYKRLEQEAEDAVRAEKRKEAEEALEAEIRAELEKPEEQERLRTEEADKLRGTPREAEIRRKVVDELETSWKTGAEADLEGEIRREESTPEKEAAFRAKHRAYVFSLKKTEDARAAIRRTLERQWEEYEENELNTSVLRDEELKKLIQEKKVLLQREIDELQKAETAGQLLKEFETVGIDVASIPEGIEVVIYLGHFQPLRTIETRETDRWGDTKVVKKDVRAVTSGRRLSFVSRGEGRLMCMGDSLSEGSVYFDDDEINPNTIVRVGHMVIEEGVGVFTQRLLAGSVLAYDLNMNEPGEKSALLPIADVVLNGKSARGVEHIEEVTL